METITQGEVNVFLLELEGFTENYLTDDDVSFKAEFFVSGKRHLASYVIEKANMVPADDGQTDNYLCAVETANFPEGELVCEFHVEYPNSLVAKTLIGKPFISTGCRIVKHT